MLQNNNQPNNNVQVIPATESINNFSSQENKKRVCAYCRVSTEEERQASSYELQVAHYTDYIQSNPSWEFIGVYADDGISGTSTKNRVQFNKMIKDCKEGRIDYIITKSISRFARNTLDCLRHIRELKNLSSPVGVYFEKENLDSLDGKSELFLTLLSSIAQEESRINSENAKWSLQKRFQRGKPHCPTKYFLGYDKDEDGNLVINEEQAVIVRRIYKDYLSGKGFTLIAKGLMKDGFLTARGNSTWTGNGVRKILINEKYCGDILMQKTVTVDFLNQKRVANKNIQPQYFLQDHHPAIIPKDEWHAVQEEMKRRRKMFVNPKGKYKKMYSGQYAFSNKFSCGECGRPVVRRKILYRGKNILHPAWHCRVSMGADKKFKDCSARYFLATEIKKGFMKILKDLDIEEVKNQIKRLGISEIEKQRIKDIEAQYNLINKQLKEMAESAAGSSNAQIYEATTNQLKYEQGILQSEMGPLIEKQQEAKSVDRHLKALEEILDEEEFKDELFLKTVERGVLHDDGRVDFEFKCGITRSIQAIVRKK